MWADLSGMTDLISLARQLSDAGDAAPLPVEDWNPSHCGEIDIVIRADGSWWHEGEPIERAALVRLFSRVLRRDEDGFVLVTPGEKLSITVEDAPFLAVDFEREEAGYTFVTTVGDRVTAGPDHPLTMRRSEAAGAVVPYVLVRGGLEARLSRAAYYRLAEELEEEDGELVLRSGGARFVLGTPE